MQTLTELQSHYQSILLTATDDELAKLEAEIASLKDIAKRQALKAQAQIDKQQADLAAANAKQAAMHQAKAESIAKTMAKEMKEAIDLYKQIADKAQALKQMQTDAVTELRLVKASDGSPKDITFIQYDFISNISPLKLLAMCNEQGVKLWQI